MYLMKKQKKVFSLPGTKPLFFTVIVVAPVWQLPESMYRWGTEPDR